VDIKSLTIAQRLRLFLDNLGIEQQEFANTLGISQQVISNALNGRTKYPKSDFLIQLIEGYPQFNIYWLLTGEGEMFTTTNNSNFSTENKVLKLENTELRNELIKAQNRIIELLETK
jgi:transcriptional regulator with XRE-family HTH domain